MGVSLCAEAGHAGSEVRRLSRRAKDAGGGARLLAIAAVDDASREDDARVGGMDRQTLRTE
jgi:hypothetical protein